MKTKKEDEIYDFFKLIDFFFGHQFDSCRLLSIEEMQKLTVKWI